MNELLDILKEAMPKVDWENGEDLVDDGVIDSMDVVTIISEITDAYDIEIPSEDLEGLTTVGSVMNYLKEKGAE